MAAATGRIPAVITYHKPGVLPPVYVAGTFSDPPWQPHEMDHTARPDGELDFKKEVEGEPGSKIAYKFRLGDGDWWVLDENAPTATDSSGNRNHVLELKPQNEQAQAQDQADDDTKPATYAETASTDTGPAPFSYAKAAAKRLQPSAGATPPNRSGTGTPIFARVAAEVADSAELLHEEVPDREAPESDAPSGDISGRRRPSVSEVAAEVADSAELLHEEVPEHERPKADASSGGVPKPRRQSVSEVAAEVADSSELLHEEVPDRERPKADTTRRGAPERRWSEVSEVAAEVADSAELLHEEVPDREGPQDDAPSGDISKPRRPSVSEVASEVADSAELLHEEVPDRDVNEDPPSSMPETSETAAEVANITETLGGDENAIFVLEPPPGEGRPFQVRDPGGLGGDFLDDQETDIINKSPLFAHECVGLYDSEEEVRPGDVAEEWDDDIDDDGYEDDHSAGYSVPADDIDPDKVDLNDPTLERFPSTRDDIMETVRKIETGLEEDRTSFAKPRDSVFIPSRRGTEDITGDHFLTAPLPLATAHRPSKKSPRASMSSLNAPPSLHSISEADEAVFEEEEDEGTYPPAVIFSNPDMKPRPKNLTLPSRYEDEGVALHDGISPRTVKPMHRPITSGTSSPQSPVSPTTTGPSARVYAYRGSVASIDAVLADDQDHSEQEHSPKQTENSPKQTEHSSKQTEHPTTAPEEADNSAKTPLSHGESSAGPSTEEADAGAAEPSGEQPGNKSAPKEGEEEHSLVKTPTSTSTTAMVKASPGGGWIKAFFRLVFVDFFGGIFGRFWRGKGKGTART